jgi:hypothetical protein
MNSIINSKSYKASGLFLLAFFHLLPVLAQDVTPIKPLNSPYDEQNPVFSPTGELFFTIGFHPENTGGPGDYGDIWFSKKDVKGEWEKAQRVSELSTSGNDVLIGFSDALTALVYHSGQNGKKQGIHQYSRFGNSWNYLRPLEMGNFKNNGTYFSGRLSADGNILIMSMASFGSFGNEDIYVSFKQSETVWTSPLNLGPQINSFAQEQTPYLSDDLQTIYFSSNTKNNRQGKDIFFSQRIGEDWNNWTSPIPINQGNTQGSEMSYVKIQGTEENAIFTSTQNSEGFGDFFVIKFQEIEPLIAAQEIQITPQEELSEATAIVEKQEKVIEEKVDDLVLKADTINSKVSTVVDSKLPDTEVIEEEKPSNLVEEKPLNKAEIKVLDAVTLNPVDYKIELGNERGLKKEVMSQNMLWNEIEENGQWINISFASKGYIPQLFDREI